MTNTNNNNEETIHWEESTKHRDKFQKTNKAGAIKSGVKAINIAIEGWNDTIAHIPGVSKKEKLDPEKTVAELAETGGSSFILGCLDDGVKFIRRVVIPKIQAGGFFTGAAAAVLSTFVASIEFAIDHLKDLMTSTAISGLAAEVGDLKDGQSKLNAKVDAQGKKMNKRMNDLKTELQGELKQQGEKFEQEIKDLDKRMAQATGENRKAIEEEKKQRQAQFQQLQSQISEVTENLNRVEKQLTDALNDFRGEVNERFEEQERKIIENKRKIEEERRQREAEVQEIKNKIKIGEQKAENLQQQLEENEDKFDKYKSQIDQKTAETQQVLEDTQAEYERKTKIIEAQIEDNQETIEEFNEQLTNVQREQAIQREQQEEILENLQETNDTLFAQQRKLNLVAEQMDDIQEEVHERMDKLSQKLDDRINETLNIAEDTNKRIDKLTDQVQNIQKETEQLQEQIKKNKEETEKAKKEAKLANERLDNLLKTQALSDFSQEQSKLDKIQKSLELKAEEAKLLATLNLLQETKKLIKPEPSEINWQVGIKKGTEKDIPRPEGMLLNPNSSWAKKYTPEQLREWGWDTRLLGEHETAPLTDEDKRKEKQAQQNEQESKAAGEESSLSQDTIEKIEQLKAEALERLAAVQQEVRTGLEEITNSPPPPPSTIQKKKQTIQQQIQQKKQQLNQKEQKTANLQKKPYSEKNQKQLEQAQKEQEKAEQELEQAQAQLSDPSFQFEQEIEKYEETIAEEKKEEVNQQWQTIQALSKQALQEQPEKEEEEKEQKEEDLQKKLEELVQQIKEMEQSAAASQKTMTYFMLFLIIFLLEYVVYKRNGLPGLVVLNVVLAVCYYHRDTLKEYADLWGKYLLILGYVMGNVLAYSAPEQQKYKWPCVIGFNIAIGLIYAYTLYQQKQEQAKIEVHYQKQSQEILNATKFTPEEQQKITSSTNQITTENTAQIFGYTNPFSNIPTSQKAEHFSQLVQEQVLEKEQIAKKEEEIAQQAETLQRAAEIEKNLSKASEGLGSPKMTWNKIKEIYPEFENKSVLLEELNKKERTEIPLSEEEQATSLTTRLERLSPVTEKEADLLDNLELTLEQYIAISLQTPYLTRKEQEFITENYLHLSKKTHFELLKAGLSALGINTYEKLLGFYRVIEACQAEKAQFGLTTEEKEKVSELIINELKLEKEQKEKLKKMGAKFLNVSEWKVSEEQKNSLLDFGLNELKLTEEQQDKLTDAHPDAFKTFALTGEQKNILNSLAPLIREDKYSLEALELLYEHRQNKEGKIVRGSTIFKGSTISFLVQEEIIPDLHTSFGVSKSSYLPLKRKFLEGEKRTLLKEKEIREKQIKETELKENKLSILRVLMIFAEKEMSHLEFMKLKLANFNYTLTDWVSWKVLTSWQVDILLTCGFKTIPKYNFFELLIFCVEKFTETSWDEFLAGNENLAKEFEEYLESLRSQEITINETIWEKFVSSQSKNQREVIQQLNLKELIEEQINQRLGNWRPIEEEIIIQETLESIQPSSSTSSKYDDLLAGLNEEERKRELKKLEREESRKKLEESELARRHSKLSEKDRKLKEQEERRQKEKELAEQEEKKREEARLAREKALREEQDAYFSTKSKNITERKKAVEEALENKKKENELEEQKKKDQIAKLEKENQEEQERLIKQSKLIEEEAQKRLAAIALEDEEQRQLIEKKAKEEKARIEAEMLEVKRKNEEELKKKENELFKQREAQEEEIRKMETEKRQAEEEERTNKELYEKEMKSRQDLERQRTSTLEIAATRMDAQRRSETLRDNNADKALRSILWYPMLADEWSRCVQGGSHFDRCPSVEDGFNRYSGLRVNPSLFQFDSGKWVNTGGGGTWVYSRADDLRKAVALCGNRWFTKNELEKHIRNSVGESF